MIFIGLAAGRGKRLRPVTDYLNKCMWPIFDRPFLAYTLENMRQYTDEVILVVGYKKEHVQTYFGTKWDDLRITYVEQTNPVGTADALYRVHTQLRINKPFIMWLADTYLSQPLIQGLLNRPQNLLAVKNVDYAPTSPIEVAIDGEVTKAFGGKSRCADIGCYKFNPEIFGYFGGLMGEQRFLKVVQRFIEDGNQVYTHEADHWIHLGYTNPKETNRKAMINVMRFFAKWGS